jgi:hypothetical protein
VKATVPQCNSTTHLDFKKGYIQKKHKAKGTKNEKGNEKYRD